MRRGPRYVLVSVLGLSKPSLPHLLSSSKQKKKKTPTTTTTPTPTTTPTVLSNDSGPKSRGRRFAGGAYRRGGQRGGWARVGSWLGDPGLGVYWATGTPPFEPTVADEGFAGKPKSDLSLRRPGPRPRRGSSRREGTPSASGPSVVHPPPCVESRARRVPGAGAWRP